MIFVSDIVKKKTTLFVKIVLFNLLKWVKIFAVFSSWFG